MLPRCNVPILIPSILVLILTSGCDDERATQIAREAADRQAQQNTAMAELNKEVASGTRQLVEADATGPQGNRRRSPRTAGRTDSARH